MTIAMTMARDYASHKFPTLLNLTPCLTRVVGGVAAGFLLTFAGFKFVVPEDPYLMLDETYLSTLKNNDDEANDAAKKVRFMGLVGSARVCVGSSSVGVGVGVGVYVMRQATFDFRGVEWNSLECFPPHYGVF